MTFRPRNPKHPSVTTHAAWVWLCGLLLFASPPELFSDPIILYLKNGDRIAGTITSETTNHVVISNTWIQNLTVPLAEIVRRELTLTNLSPTAVSPPPIAAASGTVSTNAPPIASAPPNAASATNTAGSAKLAEAIAKAVPPPAPKPKHWKAEARVGADFLLAATDQQIFYGAFKLTYEKPYVSNPKQFFRNIFAYTANYGRTEGVLSANNMAGSDKVDLDIGTQRFYLYNLAGAGYDQIRKIDFQWGAGPGVGYHLITKPAYVMNLEAGIDYQEQFRSDNTSIEKFYFRLAEDVTWKLSKQITFVEKVAWSPEIEDLSQYRARVEATLSYAFWQNFSFNVGLLNLYDTDPAKGVPNNDLQIRSSLGITF